MSIMTLVRAGLFGLAISSLVATTYAEAEALRIAGGTVQRALKVPMNRAVVVESDVVFAELSIANPGIADISTLSDRSIYVLGKAPGRTTLTLLAPDGMLITNVEVHVTADVGELKERLREVLPSESIEVRPANDGIVLSGTVSSAVALDRALDLANRYAPERVSNLMVVGGTQQVMMKVRFAEMSRKVSKSLGVSMAFNGISGDNVFGGASGSLTPGADVSVNNGEMAKRADYQAALMKATSVIALFVPDRPTHTIHLLGTMLQSGHPKKSTKIPQGTSHLVFASLRSFHFLATNTRQFCFTHEAPGVNDRS